MKKPKLKPLCDCCVCALKLHAATWLTASMPIRMAAASMGDCDAVLWATDGSETSTTPMQEAQ